VLSAYQLWPMQSRDPSPITIGEMRHTANIKISLSGSLKD